MVCRQLAFGNYLLQGKVIIRTSTFYKFSAVKEKRDQDVEVMKQQEVMVFWMNV